jgi:hypothetical protein
MHINLAADLNTLRKQEKYFNCEHNRASSIGNPCERYLYNMRLHAREALQLPDELASVFYEGTNVHEPAILREINSLPKYHTEESQGEGRLCDNGSPWVTGHWDAILYVDGKRYAVLEVKGLAIKTWLGLTDVTSLMNHSQPHIRGYYDQCQIYMMMTNLDKAILLLKNKSTGMYRQIVIERDLNRFRYLKGIALRVNEWVERELQRRQKIITTMDRRIIHKELKRKHQLPCRSVLKERWKAIIGLFNNGQEHPAPKTSHTWMCSGCKFRNICYDHDVNSVEEKLSSHLKELIDIEEQTKRYESLKRKQANLKEMVKAAMISSGKKRVVYSDVGGFEKIISCTRGKSGSHTLRITDTY